MLHRAIEGYFRLITYLQCSTNNKVEIAVSFFEQALEIYGVPSRVRTDKRGEDTLICGKIIELRGKGRRGFMNAYEEMFGIMFRASFIIFFKL